MSDLILNCQNLPCPQPVVQVRDCIETEHPKTLHVSVDNKPAFENVSRLLTHYGYAINYKEKNNVWHIIATTTKNNSIHSSSALNTASASLASSHTLQTKNDEAKILVIIASPVLGQGDDTLGEKLMATFINTLPELGEQLWRIILLNGGVKLVATPGATLEGLKKLEEANVSILVCGTCLEFFGLIEQKKVGDTTNMLDVVTSMQVATQIIRI